MSCCFYLESQMKRVYINSKLALLHPNTYTQEQPCFIGSSTAVQLYRRKRRNSSPQSQFLGFCWRAVMRIATPKRARDPQSSQNSKACTMSQRICPQPTERNLPTSSRVPTLDLAHSCYIPNCAFFAFKGPSKTF